MYNSRMNILRKTKDAAAVVVDSADIWGGCVIATTAGAALVGTLIGYASPAEIDGDGIGQDSAAYISSLPNSKRVEHDYASWSTEAGDNCLEDTGYDPFDYTKYGDSRKAHEVGKVTFSDGIITITPKEDGSLLELFPNDGTAPLQPANDQAREILERFNCETTY